MFYKKKILSNQQSKQNNIPIKRIWLNVCLSMVDSSSKNKKSKQCINKLKLNLVLNKQIFPSN